MAGTWEQHVKDRVRVLVRDRVNVGVNFSIHVTTLLPLNLVGDDHCLISDNFSGSNSQCNRDMLVKHLASM